jgi:hypothetical protein
MTEQTTGRDEDKWADIVAKLLAKAEDPATTPEEAEAFSAKAEKIIISHMISDALIAEKRGGLEAKDEIVTKRVTLDGSYVADRLSLLFRIAKPLGMEGYRTNSKYSNGGRRKIDTMVLTGFESTLKTVEFLFASLNLQMVRAAAQADRHRPYHISKVSFLKGFHDGFSRSVNLRLKAIYKKTVQDSEPGTGLVLADRASRVTAAFENSFSGKLRPRQQSARNEYAQGLGWNAGENADLNQTRVGGSRVQIGH